MNESIDISDVSKTRIYRFGDFYLNPYQRKVIKDANYIEIASKAFDILRLLVERHGEVVSKDEILEQVWDDSFVEEGNLTVYVSRLRKLLGTDKSAPFIETVSGVGYRFVSNVSEIDENEWEKLLSDQLKLSDPTLSPDSIAVLPLKNETGDSEVDYLSDGITESIINKLSYIPKLRVIARNTVFRYKNKDDLNFKKIGKELEVAHILTGRIRVIRENLVIGVELINAKSGTQIWGTQLNQPFEDIFEMQEKITRSISENLKTQIGNHANNLILQTISQNFESYRLYLKGKFYQNRKSHDATHHALECFQKSILYDPMNTHSYISIAECYITLYYYEEINHNFAINKTSIFLDKAYKLNPYVPEYFVINASKKISLEFNLNEAEQNLQQALSLNPNLADAYYYYSKIFAFRGEFSKSLTELTKLMKLDPISIHTNRDVARIFYVLGQHDNAINQLKECYEFEAVEYPTLILLGTNLVEIEQYDEALKFFNKAINIYFHLETLAMIGYTYARIGKIKETQNILKQLEEISTQKYVLPTYFAIIHSAMHETDKVFEYLEKAYVEKCSDIIALKVDPRYKSVRKDSRFNDMLRKIGLPTE